MSYNVLTQLHEDGVTLLRGVLPLDVLSRLKDAARDLNFPPISCAVPLTALPELAAPVDGLTEFASAALSQLVECRLQHSWLRKRFAPRNAPRHYQPNSWHQDGGLGAAFTSDPTRIPEMTRLITCWIPLQDCGQDSPGLEVVRRPLDRLLHYTELDDIRLRQRFANSDFWSPDLEFGDGLFFLPGTLHRTHVHSGMQHDRLSLEYRFFPV